MGRFIYDADTSVAFDDRVLVHLQIVIVRKLRSRECFAFTWKVPALEGGGRHTVWMHPGASVQFRFDGSRVPSVNDLWLRDLTTAAHTPTGLQLVAEPDPASSASWSR